MSPAFSPLPTAPWGPSIGVYFILAGIAAGTSLIAEWLRPQDERQAVAFAWTMGWCSMIALLLCGVILIVDLGQPRRFVLMLTSFANLGSAMSVGAKLIALKGFLLILHLALLGRRRRAIAAGDTALAPGITQTVYRMVPASLAVASLCLAVYPGMLLARTWSSPLATNPGTGLLFVTTALLMGAAVGLLLARDAVHASQLRGKLLFLASAQLCLFLLTGLSLYGGSPTLARVLTMLLTGQAATLFWGVAVVLGLVLPLGALVLGWRQRLVTRLSALGLLVGAATLRWLFFTVA